MCSQMRKRLRAEIYISYLKMGKQGLQVDPQLYEVVRKNLASRELCGPHVAVWSDPLPVRVPKPTPAKKIKTHQFQISDSVIDSIVAEEPPSAQVWHRYLGRWKGYDPAWEAWRIPGRGSPGDPIESWEPATSLIGTQALAQWQEQTVGRA